MYKSRGIIFLTWLSILWEKLKKIKSFSLAGGKVQEKHLVHKTKSHGFCSAYKTKMILREGEEKTLTLERNRAKLWKV